MILMLADIMPYWWPHRQSWSNLHHRLRKQAPPEALAFYLGEVQVTPLYLVVIVQIASVKTLMGCLSPSPDNKAISHTPCAGRHLQIQEHSLCPGAVDGLKTQGWMPTEDGVLSRPLRLQFISFFPLEVRIKGLPDEQPYIRNLRAAPLRVVGEARGKTPGVWDPVTLTLTGSRHVLAWSLLRVGWGLDIDLSTLALQEASLSGSSSVCHVFTLLSRWSTAKEHLHPSPWLCKSKARII